MKRTTIITALAAMLSLGGPVLATPDGDLFFKDPLPPPRERREPTKGSKKDKATPPPPRTGTGGCGWPAPRNRVQSHVSNTGGCAGNPGRRP